jgi:hypothetical protein
LPGANTAIIAFAPMQLDFSWLQLKMTSHHNRLNGSDGWKQEFLQGKSSPDLNLNFIIFLFFWAIDWTSNVNLELNTQNNMSTSMAALTVLYHHHNVSSIARASMCLEMTLPARDRCQIHRPGRQGPTRDLRFTRNWAWAARIWKDHCRNLLRVFRTASRIYCTPPRAQYSASQKHFLESITDRVVLADDPGTQYGAEA